jgi:hypothetical protein
MHPSVGRTNINLHPSKVRTNLHIEYDFITGIIYFIFCAILYNYSLLLRSMRVFMDLENDIHRKSYSMCRFVLTLEGCKLMFVLPTEGCIT